MVALSNLANCYSRLGRDREALVIYRDAYEKSRAKWGDDHHATLSNGCNLGSSLVDQEAFDEAREFLRLRSREAKRSLGLRHDVTLTLRRMYARALYGPEDASLEDCREAEILLEADAKVSTRVLGADHPHTQRYAHLLGNTRHRRDQALNRARSAAAATSQVTSPL